MDWARVVRAGGHVLLPLLLLPRLPGVGVWSRKDQPEVGVWSGKEQPGVDMLPGLKGSSVGKEHGTWDGSLHFPSNLVWFGLLSLSCLCEPCVVGRVWRRVLGRLDQPRPPGSWVSPPDCPVSTAVTQGHTPATASGGSGGGCLGFENYPSGEGVC